MDLAAGHTQNPCDVPCDHRIEEQRRFVGRRCDRGDLPEK
jgi:hypothetical protein